jgi:LacI family transcriptional regulator
MADIARMAGVSTSTVSRVINGESRVGPELYERVRKVLENTEYHLSPPGKKRTESTTIALVVPDVMNPFFHMVLHGVEDACRRFRFSAAFYSSGNNAEIEQENIKAILDTDFPGVLFIPNSNDSVWVQQLLDAERRVVFLDRVVPGIDVPQVTANNQNGAYQATKYLLNLGHRRILYLGGNRLQSTEINRSLGFRKAFQNARIELDDDLVVSGSFELQAAYDEARDALDRNLEFTAILCADDIIALGAKNAVEEAGLRVPEDVSIVGYDDIPFAKYISLTTVRQPAYELGKNAVLLIADLLDGRTIPRRETVLEPSLIIRSTCAKPALLQEESW